MRQQIVVATLVGFLGLAFVVVWVFGLPGAPEARPSVRATATPPPPKPTATSTPPAPTLPTPTLPPTPRPTPTPVPTLIPTRPTPTQPAPTNTPLPPPLFVEVLRPQDTEMLRGKPEVEVVGRTLPGSFVQIFYESGGLEERVKSVQADGHGDFAGVVPLAPNVNILEVISGHSSSNRQVRWFVQVTYDPTPLLLTVSIDAPLDGDRVDERVITVSGNSLPNADVVLNGVIPVLVDDTGGWWQDVVLQRGPNEIAVVATAGDQTASASITVTYIP